MLGRRRRGPGTTEDERLVAAAILHSCEDPRTERLYQQFARSIIPIRDSSTQGFTVKPGGTTEDLLAPLEHDVTSSWVRVHDVATGQPLQFRVTLLRAGFFYSLEGQAVEGSWPRDWHVEPAAVREAAKGSLRLPAQMDRRCLPKLLAWLNIDEAAAGLVCHKEASKVDIDHLVRHEGASLPTLVPTFLRITDGLEIGGLAVFGHRDLYVVDIEDHRHWLVALEDDAHFLMMPGESSVCVLPSHDGRITDMIVVANSFQEWLRRRLTEPPAAAG